MVYVFVTGHVKVTAPTTKGGPIKQILRWIGYNTDSQRESIYDDSIDSFSDIRMLTEIYF